MQIKRISGAVSKNMTFKKYYFIKLCTQDVNAQIKPLNKE